MQRDHHIAWLQIAVNDPFLVGMLDGSTNRQEQFESLAARSLFWSQKSVRGTPLTSSIAK